MATAELVRKSPFDHINQGYFERSYVLTHLIISALLGGGAYWAYAMAPENMADQALMALGVAFMIAVIKSPIYGFVGLVFAIGMSPDSVIFNNVRLEDYLLPPLMVIWWLKRSAQGVPLVESPIMSSVKLYMLIAAIATLKGMVAQTVWSNGMAITFYMKYAQYFVIMWFAMNSIKKREDVLVLLLASFGACAVVAYASNMGRLDVLAQGTRTFVRASGPQGETPNVLGGYYLIHIMFGFALIFATKNYLYRMVLVAFLYAVAFPLLYTYSRTSFASLFVGLLVVCVFIDLRYIFLVGLFAICHQLFLPHLQSLPVDESFIDRYGSILDIFGDDDSKPSSWTARVAGWYIYYGETVRYDPFLGKGVGSTTMVVDSSFVKKFIETGMLGTLAFLAFLMRLGRLALEVIRNEKEALPKSVAIGYMGVLSAMVAHSVGVCSFSTIRTAEPFFLFSGMLLSLHVMMRKKKELEEEDDRDLESLRFDR